MKVAELSKEFEQFKFDMNLFRGRVESEIGNRETIGNIGRNMEVWSDGLEKYTKETEKLKEAINLVRIDMAVHEVKLARSGAFYGAMSGMVIAVVTALIINFTTNTTEVEHPKVIYKNSKEK